MGLKNSEEKATPKLHVQYAWFQNSFSCTFSQKSSGRCDPP